jgi:fucose permease
MLCAGFLLAGMGTVLLGPILPLLSTQWHLADSAAGALLFAKFAGAFTGGITVRRRLPESILLGSLAAAAGWAAFAYSTNELTAACELFVCGFGLGQIIAATNILAGARYRDHTGAALAAINFFWSLGAVITGLVVAMVVPHTGLRAFLGLFAALFVIVGFAGRLFVSAGEENANVAHVEQESPPRLPTVTLWVFFALLFFYGGLETSLSQWLTTFTTRYIAAASLTAQSPLIVFWAAITAGRAIASLLLRRVREATLQRGGLALALVLVIVLARCTTARGLTAASIALGLSLAPFFPTTFALLMRLGPSPRWAGAILSVSGLGAAGFSWLVGEVATATGSLRLAMAVPLAACVALLALTVRERPVSQRPA